MRGVDGRLIADLNDNLPANASGSILSPATSSIDENQTEYILLPELINDPPYISQSIYDTSTPLIKPIQFNQPGLQNMFVDSQGVVKVLIGTSFKLKLKAQQPPVYNIENGKPTLIVDTLPLPPPPVPGVEVSSGTLESKIVYTWRRDDVIVQNEIDIDRPGASIAVGGTLKDELVINNISPKFAGTYVCEVSNDIGVNDSEQITIEVYNPDVEDFFYNNLVENPYGKNDTDQWLTPDQDFKTNRLSNTEFKNLSQPWNRDTFGYTVDMFYPRPYHINTYHIKNSNFTEDLLREGYYFTRDVFKYKAKDGKAIINAEYDVDLTDAVDYIQGSVYGVDGVRAVFGAYLGNAISRYKSTITTALVEYRNFKNTVDITKPRPSPENCLLAGVPVLDETVTVVITEMDNDTPLMSTIYDVNTGATVTQPGCVVFDPWTRGLSSINQNIQIYPPGSAGYVSLGNTNEEKIIHVANNVLQYPSRDYIATHAQYVEWNKVVIDKLNFKTNKIRISLNFTTTTDVLTDTTTELLDESDACFESHPWELIAKTGRFPQTFPDDYFSTTVNGKPNQFVSLYYLNKTSKPNNTSPTQFYPLLGPPRALVTGLNLVLIPLESTEPAKVKYYTKTILEGNVNPSNYTAINTAVTPLTGVGQYLASLGYDTEYIGVHLTNIWRVPHRIQDVDPANNIQFSDNLGAAVTKDGADIASLTAISTLKYMPNPAVGTDPSAEVYNLTDDPKNNWAFTGLRDVEANISGNVEVIYFTGSQQDVVQGALPDILGTIQSGVVNFLSSGITTSTPIGYVTKSIGDTDGYKRNLGFYFDFEIHKYGFDIPGADTASLFRAWKEADPSWTVQRIRHKHNIFQDITKDYDNIPTLPPPPPPPGGGPSGPPPPQIVDTYYTLQWDKTIIDLLLNDQAQKNTYNALVNTAEAGYRVCYLGNVNYQSTSSFVRAKLTSLPRPAFNSAGKPYTTATSDAWRLGAQSIIIGLEGYDPAAGLTGGPVEYYYWVLSRGGLKGTLRQGRGIKDGETSILGIFPYSDPATSPPEATLLYSGSDKAAIDKLIEYDQLLDVYNLPNPTNQQLADAEARELEILGWGDWVGQDIGPNLPNLPNLGGYKGDWIMTGLISPDTADVDAWPYQINDVFEIVASPTAVKFYQSGQLKHQIPRLRPDANLRAAAKHCSTGDLIVAPVTQIVTGVDLNGNPIYTNVSTDYYAANINPDPVGGLTNVQWGHYDPSQPLAGQKSHPAIFTATNTGWLDAWDEYEVNGYLI